MSRLITACALVAISACAPKEDANGDGIADGVNSPDSVSQIAPSTPVGTISGLVVNSSYLGLEGVQVTLVLGEGADASRTYKTSTNGEGAYFFKDVPAGSSAQLLFSKSGYSNARLNGNVPGAGGNFPINDGNGNAGVVTLAQLNGTVRWRVYASSGKPAKGARAYLEVQSTAFVTSNSAYGSTCGNFSATAEVDENGQLTFTGAPDPAELSRINPNINYALTLGAWDEDGDGRSESLGALRTYAASALFTEPDRNNTIVLPDARVTGGLSILATNLDSFASVGSPPYRNAVKGSDPITIVFNQPITQVDTTRVVKVVQEDCQTNVAVSISQRTPNVLSIAPQAAWTLGSRYNIIVRATGLDTGTTTDFIGYFFAIDPTAPRPLSNTAAFQVRKAAANMMTNVLQPGDSLYVVFDMPVTLQSMAGPLARAYVQFDLNGDSTVGGMTGLGEYNGPANSGPAIAMAEQLSATDPAAGTFSCKASGYSSRWQITIPNFPSNGQIPSNIQMRVQFPRDQASSDTYQTVWGSPIAADVTGNINILP